MAFPPAAPPPAFHAAPPDMPRLDRVLTGTNYPYRPFVQRYARQYGLEEPLLRAVIQQESKFNPQAQSHAGAMGLGQLMPSTWNQWIAPNIPVSDPWNPEDSIHGAAYWLRQNIREFGGDLRQGIASYNAGPPRIHANEWPAETQVYVPAVMGYYNEYR